jgi:hypothetical protein
MLDFLMVFHADTTRKSCTAIIWADNDDDAKRKAHAMAAFDGRAIELWRNQQLIVRIES